ncbi:MAG: hypothetical protein HIU57_00135 [Acidobacteria bacterium]|nr:hypothetical protein [Acidobacteriota bacterium]
MRGLSLKRVTNRWVLLTAMVVSLTLGASAVAVAHQMLTPLQRFQVAQQLYKHDLFVINQKFSVAIIHDKAVEAAALSAAKSPAQKYLVRVNFNLARANDVAIWEADLKKLGAAPLLWEFTHPATTTTTTALASF